MATISTTPVSHPAYRGPTTKPVLTAAVQEVVDDLVAQTQPARLQAFLARPASVLPNTEDEDANEVAEIHLASNDAASAYSRASSTTAPEVCAAPVAAAPIVVAPLPVTAAPASKKSAESLTSQTSSVRSRMSAGFKQYRKDVKATFAALNAFHVF